MKLSSGYEDKKARVEMVPLIDIVFLLLVFFIYAMLSMVVHRGLKVQLPAAASATVDKRDYVSVMLTKDNAIYLDDMRVSLDELVPRVVDRRGTKKDMPVFIRGDSQTGLGLAIRVLDLLRGAGIAEVSFECAEEPK
jgi:biopolymer transport protein ExbD